MLFDTAETEAPEGLEDTESATADIPAAEETGLTAEIPATEIDLGETTGKVPAIDATGESPALDESGELPAIDETGESPAIDETGELPATDESAEVAVVEDTGLTAEMPATGEGTGLTAEMPTAETPMTATDATGETPTIEEQFKVLEETGELPSLSIGDDEATKLASLDDDDEEYSSDSTGEIEIDDLGLDLDELAKTGLGSDLDDTAEREVLPVDDDLVATGTNEAMDADDDLAATGRNPAVDTDAGTGIHEALNVEDALAASSETEIAATDATSRNPTLADIEDTGIGAAIDTSLLDATGQTQVLTDDMAVETASEIEDIISDQDKTLLVPADDDSSEGLPEDAETLLAPLDDEDSGGDESTVLSGSDEDFDFAKTEALPKDVFMGNDPKEDTGELPGIAETDMDLDLDDLTAALRVSEVGDTVDQLREDETVEHPRPSGNDADLDVGDTDEEEDSDPTTRLAPEDVSGDLHDARTMTEVGTKLDLARAYVDMGDPGGARSILEEVLDEGDDSQKQQAQQLLDTLPG
jgi:pilus assembly protein FimV